MSDPSERSVFRSSKEKYGESFTAHLLEQYKLYVSSAENVSLRRVTSNRYMFAISAALVALYGAQSTAWGHDYWMLLFPVIGIASSWFWIQLINSHSDLNTIKFRIIHEFEQYLPAAPFDAEWIDVQSAEGPNYKEVTKIERAIPLAFIAVYAVIFVMILLASANVYDWTPGSP